MFDTKYLPKDYNPDRDPDLFKWFIENPYGEWAADPNTIGESWTRSPLKAWTFENISTREGWPSYDTWHPRDYHMFTILQREGLFENCRMTKYLLVHGDRSPYHIVKSSMILLQGNSYLYFIECTIDAGIKFTLNNQCMQNCSITNYSGSAITIVNNPLFDDPI